MGKKKKNELVRDKPKLTVYMDAELHRAIRMAAADKEVSMNVLAAKILRQNIEKPGYGIA